MLDDRDKTAAETDVVIDDVGPLAEDVVVIYVHIRINLDTNRVEVERKFSLILVYLKIIYIYCEKSKLDNEISR